MKLADSIDVVYSNQGGTPKGVLKAHDYKGRSKMDIDVSACPHDRTLISVGGNGIARRWWATMDPGVMTSQ